MTTAEAATALAAAETAAEAIRALNHATLHTRDFHVADVYRIQSDLVTLAQRLPQTLGSD